MTISRKLLLCAVTLALMLLSQEVFAGRLFLGNDDVGTTLGVCETNAETITGCSLIPLSGADRVNGVGELDGVNGSRLVTGWVPDNRFDTRDLRGNILSSGTGGFPNSAFNEDYAGNGSELWHVHFSEGVFELDRANGAVLQQFPLNGFVGITFVDSDLWVSNFNARTIGTFDVSSGLYTPVFGTGARSCKQLEPGEVVVE